MDFVLQKAKWFYENNIVDCLTKDEIVEKTISEFSYDSELGQGFIYGSAKNSDGNNVVFRITVNESDGKITLQASGANSESCTGINCELCPFANNGGCTCARVGSIMGGTPVCNHLISR